jgi:hypothetical protein
MDSVNSPFVLSLVIIVPVSVYSKVLEKVRKYSFVIFPKTREPLNILCFGMYSTFEKNVFTPKSDDQYELPFLKWKDDN